MYVQRILYPVIVLGVGKRIGIWLQGCPHHCKGCINPDLWEQKIQNNLDVSVILDNIRLICDKNKVDGITISGGDPVYQFEELLYLVTEIQKMDKEILVYTGYEVNEIKAMPYGELLLNKIDVLIDGKYVDELNEDGLALRGSSNQNIIFRTEEISNRYKEYLSQGRNLQHFYQGDYILSIGIHDRRKYYDE